MPDRTDIRRIGRAPTPAERGLQFALEDGELLEYLALNLFENALGLESETVPAVWESLAANQRTYWMDRAVTRMHEHIATEQHPHPGPDEPDPGNAQPEPDTSESHLRIA
jgi:hypothetical protein